MVILGYILATSKVRDVPGYIEVINDVSLADASLPLLIVGYENAKSNINGFTPLERVYEDGRVRWILSKTEHRGEYEKGLKEFYEYVVASITDKCKYAYVNVTKMHQKEIDSLKAKLQASKPDLTVWDSWNMDYVLSGDTVYGVSKEIVDYCGLKETMGDVLRCAKSVSYVNKESKSAVNEIANGLIKERFKCFFYSKTMRK
jgi:hypothetical protein